MSEHSKVCLYERVDEFVEDGGGENEDEAVLG
jgi:hypothetical protein